VFVSTKRSVRQSIKIKCTDNDLDGWFIVKLDSEYDGNVHIGWVFLDWVGVKFLQADWRV
jgi:hypothetical protein